MTPHLFVRPIILGVAVALCGFPGSRSALAQDGAVEIRPGHPSLDTTPIRSGIDSLAIFVVEETEAFIIGNYLLETIIENRRITRSESMLGPGGEVIWGEAATLEDGSLRLVSVRAIDVRDEGISVAGDELVRHWTKGDEGHEQRVSFDAPSFYPNTLDLALRSLPLEQGYSARLVVFDPETLVEWRVPIHVERAVDVADVSGLNSTTWEVHVDLDGAVDVYHIDQETRALIRYESAAERMVMVRW